MKTPSGNKLQRTRLSSSYMANVLTILAHYIKEESNRILHSKIRNVRQQFMDHKDIKKEHCKSDCRHNNFVQILTGQAI